MPDLPDTAGLGAHHGLAGFAREGFGEFRHVSDYSVNAVLFRRVGVGDGAGTLAFGAFFAAVPLGKADEETLLGGEASDGLELFSGGGGFPGVVGEGQAAQIGDVLAEREFAVDLDLVNDRVL